MSYVVRLSELLYVLDVEEDVDNDDDDGDDGGDLDGLVVLVEQKNRQVRCCSVSFQTLPKFSVTFLVFVRPKPGSGCKSGLSQSLNILIKCK